MAYSQAPESAYQKKIRGDNTQLRDHICKEMNSVNLHRCRWVSCGWLALGTDCYTHGVVPQQHFPPGFTLLSPDSTYIHHTLSVRTVSWNVS